MEESLIQFRAWLRTEGITQLKLKDAMGYSQTYVSQVLNGKKRLYKVFVAAMRIALIEKLCLDPERVESEIAHLLSSL